MGDRAKNFTNVYLKNFGEEIDDDKLREMMELYGKIISAKVLRTLSNLQSVASTWPGKLEMSMRFCENLKKS